MRYLPNLLALLFTCLLPCGMPAAGSDDSGQAAKALADYNSQAGLMAAWQLSIAERDISEALPVLADSLDDPDWRIRWLAAKGIGSAAQYVSAEELAGRSNAFYMPQSYPALSSLWPMLDDEQPEVRRAAAQALEQCAFAIHDLPSQYARHFDLLGDSDHEVVTAMRNLAVDWLNRPLPEPATEDAAASNSEYQVRRRVEFVRSLAWHAANIMKYGGATQVLWDTGDPSFESAIEALQKASEKSTGLSRVSWRILTDTKEVSSKTLCRMIDSGNQREFEQALEVLPAVMEAGTPSLPSIIGFIEGDLGYSEAVTYNAIREIRMLGPAAGQRGAEALMLLAEDERYEGSVRDALIQIRDAASPAPAEFYCNRLIETWHRNWPLEAIEVLRWTCRDDPYTLDYIKGILQETEERYINSDRKRTILGLIDFLGEKSDPPGREVPLLLNIFQNCHYKTSSGGNTAEIRLAVADALRKTSWGCADYVDQIVNLIENEPMDNEARESLMMAIAGCKTSNPEAVRFTVNALDTLPMGPKTRQELEWEIAVCGPEDGISYEELANIIGYPRLVAAQPELISDPEMAGEALPQIIEYLENDRYNDHLVWELCPAIQKLEDPPDELIEALAIHLDYYSARPAVIDTLITLGPYSADVFTSMLESEDYSDRYNGALGLAAMGDPNARQAVPRLLELVLDESLPSSHRNHFASALAQIGLMDEATPDEMIQLLKRVYALNPHPLEDEEQQSLYLTQNRDIQQALREMQDAEKMAAEVERIISGMGAPIVDPLVSAASGLYNIEPQQWGSTRQYSNPGWDSQLRLRSIAMLGMAGPVAESAVPFLVKTLQTNMGQTAGYTAWGFYGDKIDIPSSRARLAAEALGQIGVASDEVVLALLDAANSGDAELRNAAVAALEMLADNAAQRS